MAVVIFGESSPVNLRIETLFASQSAATIVPGPIGSPLATYFYSAGPLAGASGKYEGVFTGGTSFLITHMSVGATSFFDWLGGLNVNLSTFQNGGAESAAVLMVGNDDVSGSSHADTLEGYAGADLIRGLGGNDALFGGDGADSLDGGAGADSFNGGADFDFVRYETATSGGVIVSLAAGAGYAGDSLGDVISVDVEGLVGSAFADILVGSAGGNTIFGSFGGDYLFGLGGVDVLYGDAGADVIYGGSNVDFLVGGTDADSFVTAALDVAVNVFDYIYDFQDGLDVILLQGWVPGSQFLFESGGHTFITSSAVGFTGGVIVLNATLAQVQDQVLIV